MTIRRIAAVMAVFSGLGYCCSSNNSTPEPPPPPFVVKMIGFNDYHGNLQSPGTFGVNTAVAAADRPPVGSADFVAAHVARLKSQNPLSVVVGGDSIGATPLISALFWTSRR